MRPASEVSDAAPTATADLPRLTSVRVARPTTVWQDEPWVTSIFKMPVKSPVMLRRMNLDGDEQADLRVHGGFDKAVCVYPVEHYPWWREALNLLEMEPGAFGENFSVTGQSETDVCVGDRYEVGEALVEVSQPRTPCWKLGRRWGVPRLAEAVITSGWTGWYLRVIREGAVSMGVPLVLTARPFPEWTIEKVLQLAFEDDAPRDQVRKLASCPALPPGWRRLLERRLRPATAAR
jgi:MOSC domain-containing protein YiiM